MAQSLRDLDKNDEVRIIVLRADGDHFSSGGNIEGFMQETPETLTMLAQNVMTPEKIRKPVIAAIQGYCFGVGFEFSLACDFRIVTQCAELSPSKFILSKEWLSVQQHHIFQKRTLFIIQKSYSLF